MNLQPLTKPAVRYILQNLRKDDHAELSAMRWDDDLTHIADEVPRLGAFGWVAGKEMPIAAIGALPIFPGAWSVWMFATDEFPRISLSLTRFALRCMFPALKKTGARRLECRTLASHSHARRWIEFLGGYKEVDLPGYGKNGEDFCCYVWRRTDGAS